MSRRGFFYCCLAGGLAAIPLVRAQGIITTIAGTDWIFPPDGRPALELPVGGVTSVLAAPDGAVYFADQGNHMVMRVAPDGILTVVAGNGIRGYSGDGGPATSGALNFPNGAALDPQQNLYITDNLNFRIRKVSASGVISTMAGNGQMGASGDGVPAGSATLGRVRGVLSDTSGTLYFLEDNRVRRMTPDGVLSTVAGSGAAGFSGDGGSARAAALNGPLGLALGPGGTIYVADTGNHRIRRFSLGGSIETVAGAGARGYSGDGGSARTAMLNSPAAVGVDSGGVIYIADTNNFRIRRVGTDQIIRTLAGTGTEGFSGNTPAGGNAMFSLVYGLWAEAAGGLLVADQGNFRVRRVGTDGSVTTVAGNGGFRNSPDGTAAIAAFLANPASLAVDPFRNLYIADTFNHRIRKRTPDGFLSTVAGDGVLGYNGDFISPLRAHLFFPYGVSVDSRGEILIADSNNNRIRRVPPGGLIETIAGTGVLGYSGDGGEATRARLNTPVGVAAGEDGSVFFSDTLNHVVRRIRRDGIVSTFLGAGVRGPFDFLDAPTGLVHAGGNLYIADSNNQRVVRVAPNGSVFSIGGGGLRRPRGVAVDSSGGLYVADAENHQVKRVAPDGSVAIVAGSGREGFSGDGGPAALASMRSPVAVAVDLDGTVYIADRDNDRVRAVLNFQPPFEVGPASLQLSGRSEAAPTPEQGIRVSSPISGLPFTIALATTDGGNWLRAGATRGSMPASVQISGDPRSLGPGRYRGTVTVTAPNASPPSRTVEVTFTVERAAMARLGVDPTAVSFAFARGAGSSSRQLSLLSHGGAQPFRLLATTDTGGDWLLASASSGTALPEVPVLLSLIADPSGLDPGTYSGAVAITGTATGDRIDLPVTMSISASRQKILLSQAGLTFTAESRSGAVTRQSFGVFNDGLGAMSWTLSSRTLSGGSGWLSVSPSSGFSTGGSGEAPLATAGVTAAGLAPGDYYGVVQVRTGEAANSPQSVLVLLNVLPPGSSRGVEVAPSGLIFTGAAGAAPGSQNLVVSNLTPRPVSFTSSRAFPEGGNWFLHLPTNATLQPGDQARIVVQPDFAGLGAGIRRGDLTLAFSDGATRTVAMVGVASSGAGGPRGAVLQRGCRAAQLAPQIISLANGFTVPASQPTPIRAKVVDNCENPVANGTVTARFSNQDPEVRMAHERGGEWTGTWQPRNTAAGQVQIVVEAVARIGEERIVAHSARVSGSFGPGATVPLVTPGAVLNAASFRVDAPVAPGGLISIFGSRLAQGAGVATSAPLGTELANAEVVLGDQPLPLLYASDGQVNAQVPYDLPANTQHQLMVRRGTALSVPETITVAPAQPAIFTTDQSGRGQGVIVHGITQRLAEPATAATPGDVLVIYCTGLGAVSPPVAAGAAAPSSPLSRTVNTVTVNIGGQRAQVLFSGLTPGFAGLYQVNVEVPAGVRLGDRVPVTLSVAGQTSPSVTIAVR